MTEILILALVAVAAMVCMLDWRRGIYVVVLAGFLQDPIRKILPGEPVAFTLLAGALFGCCMVGAIAQGEKLGFREINRWNPVLAVPAILFVAWVLFQSVMAFVNTQSIVLPGIGLIAYLAPLPALLLGGCFTARRGEMEKFLRFYILVSAGFSLSLLLEVAGVSWRALGSVGEGFFFYPETGGEVALRAGFFRSPEIAGWHAGAGICFVVCLTVARREIRWVGMGQAVLITIFVLALLLSGRRKFLVEIVLFLSLYGFFLVYFRSGFGRLAAFLVICGTLSAGFFHYVSTRELSQVMPLYTARGITAQRDAAERLQRMTTSQFGWVIKRNGILGRGAGTGSQGAQHFGGGAKVVGAAAEGGLAKVLAELGVPGLLLLAALGMAFLRFLWSACETVREDSEIADLTYGLAAFLISNALVFTTAHQIFGDVFVLLLLGLVVSFLLNAPLLARSTNASAMRVRTPRLPLQRARMT
jgi:hypothetical protein